MKDLGKTQLQCLTNRGFGVQSFRKRKNLCLPEEFVNKALALFYFLNLLHLPLLAPAYGTGSALAGRYPGIGGNAISASESIGSLSA